MSHKDTLFSALRENINPLNSNAFSYKFAEDISRPILSIVRFFPDTLLCNVTNDFYQTIKVLEAKYYNTIQSVQYIVLIAIMCKQCKRKTIKDIHRIYARLKVVLSSGKLAILR